MSEQVIISNNGVAEVVIEKYNENVIISEVGAQGPKGDPGVIDETQPINFLILKSNPSEFLYKLTLNDDGSIQIDPYAP